MAKSRVPKGKGIDTLLPRLHEVRHTGEGRWMACCPAHDDHSPSLSIREVDDGTVLLHCFAGCDFHSVVSAVGMEPGDLFPEGSDPHRVTRPQPMPPSDALAGISHEAMVVALIASDIMHHKEVEPATWQRLAQSVERINAARDSTRWGRLVKVVDVRRQPACKVNDIEQQRARWRARQRQKARQ